MLLFFTLPLLFLYFSSTLFSILFSTLFSTLLFFFLFFILFVFLWVGVGVSYEGGQVPTNMRAQNVKNMRVKISFVHEELIK